MAIDLLKVKVSAIEGIDHSDCPDYCDAYITEAEYDGKPMTGEQLDELNENTEFIQQAVFNYLH